MLNWNSQILVKPVGLWYSEKYNKLYNDKNTLFMNKNKIYNIGKFNTFSNSKNVFQHSLL